MTGMTRMFIAAVAITCVPSIASAQQIHIDVDRAAAATIAVQPPYGRVPGASVHCCSRKGALIGAIVGAAVGVSIGWVACTERDCLPRYVAVVAMTTGIGAGIGALSGSPSARGPVIFPVARVRF